MFHANGLHPGRSTDHQRTPRVSVAYLSLLGEASFSGSVKLLLIPPLADHRGACDPMLAHAVRIVTSQHEDRASCLQMAVNVALDEGMAPQIVQTVLGCEYPPLSESLFLVVQFTDGCSPGTDLNKRPGMRLKRDLEQQFTRNWSSLLLAHECFPL